MQDRLAFLRAINVGGRVVKMDRLRAIFASLGLLDVKTFIASGNVIFRSELAEPELRALIEPSLLDELGFKVGTFLREPADLLLILQHVEVNGYDDYVACSVGFLHEPLSENQLSLLKQMETEIDQFDVLGREFYWQCRLKQSESKFSNAQFERRLGTHATFRSINSLRRLSAKVS